MSWLCRIVSGSHGIYAAVDRDCPRADPRRANKPDGTWLPKVGEKFPGAISFWKPAGLARYESSGLRDWHASVVKDSPELWLSAKPDRVLYEDEFQVIAPPSDFHVYRLRRATPDDAIPLAHLHVAVWRESYADLMPAAFLANLDPEARAKQHAPGLAKEASGELRRRALLLECPTNGLIGFSVAGEARNDAFGPQVDGELYAIYLRQKWQGKKLGGVLFREQARWMRSAGFRRWGLWVIDANPTRAFYERSGFELSPLEKTVEFGGRPLREVAYTQSLR